MLETYPRRIYLLSPSDLSPETIAVTFAKTSRSPLSFREIAAELSDEKSAQFHEKWVVGYGHASVAEHAVLHIAFENISRLAIETIEGNRLASYTEKSTRYQRWDPEGFYLPAEVKGSEHEETFRQTCKTLFKTYHESLAPVRSAVQSQYPRREAESETSWDRRIRTRYVDVCRFLLPAASLANVGMTVNARALEHAIRKMLSHPLAEVRQIGLETKQTAQEEVPTLVKYAEAVPYLSDSEADLSERAVFLKQGGRGEDLSLLSYDPDAERTVLAAALYTHDAGPFQAALRYVRSLDEAGLLELARALLGRLGRFDVPPRVLEHAVYSFEAVIDQGAYFEVKRHRMMTQTPQRLTADLGYAIPRLISEAGFEGNYCAAMDAAAEAYHRLEMWNPHVAAYLLPNGFNRRLLMTLNLREVFHFCELRAAPNAHFSMRVLALRIAEAVRGVHPILAAFMRLPEETDWRQLREEHFTRV